MNYYNLLKINTLVRNPRLKFLGLFLLHTFKRRYLSVHFDPVNACNLRCKMCYFTDKDYVKKLKGIFKTEELPLLSKAILKRAVKLQVGCGTEPTLFKDLDLVFKMASEARVPYVSMTTNANLIERDKLEQWAANGLNEITVSLHGVYEDTYKELMGRGDYHRFLESLGYITEVKEKYPKLKLRVNYTFNEDNFDQLKDFWKVFKDIDIDVLQIRPIVQIGNTAYDNFSLDKIIPKYEAVCQPLFAETKRRGATLLAPEKEQLIHRESQNSIIRQYTYCYISPTYFWKDDFDWKNETFESYSKRTGLGKELFRRIFGSHKEYKALENRSLNYNIV